ncbi:hypothetical protein GGI43DRAFT_396939 [Trichoderma evansii]
MYLTNRLLRGALLVLDCMCLVISCYCFTCIKRVGNIRDANLGIYRCSLISFDGIPFHRFLAKRWTPLYYSW